MAIVCVVVALLLMVSAWNSDTRGTRAWLLLWACVNLAIAGHMVATSFPYAWALMPPGEAEPGYRR